MLGLAEVPEWLGAAVATGIIAAVGYIAKQILDWRTTVRATKAARLGRLVELQSLLRAGWVSFVVQNDHAKRLIAMIVHNHGDLITEEEGFERIFARAFPYFTSEEQELHSIIRSITINSLSPTNEALSEWLKSDAYFKAQWHRKGIGSELARKLADLETHLILWRAKYEAWIPNTPEHALVYLADEEEHGVRFPSGLDQIVQNALNEPSVFGA